MKKSILNSGLQVLLFLFVCFPVLAQLPTVEWARRYDGTASTSADNQAIALAVDAAGNSYVTGISEKNGIQRIATVKYAPSGQQLWAVQFEDHSTVVAIATDNTGGVYVTGAANGDYITVRYNATTGAQDWAAHYDGGGYDREDGTATTHQQTRKDLKRLPKAYLPLTSTI